MGKFSRIAVIGAGLAGLTMASRLQASGHDVEVFEKSRGLGGRLASRRTARGAFDHGCPGIQSRNAQFLNWLSEAGAVRQGDHHFGVPGMSALVTSLAEKLTVRRRTTIKSLRSGHRGWQLLDDTLGIYGPFDAVALAIPAPQAVALLAPVRPRLADTLRSATMVPVWTCLAAFDRRLDLPDHVPGAGDFLRADRGSAKPGRERDPETWVIHMTPAATRQMLELDRNMIAPEILDRFGEMVGLRLPAARHLDAHRWRYAFAERPLGQAFAGSADMGVLVGGDWALGQDAESAWASGNAMAEALLPIPAATA